MLYNKIIDKIYYEKISSVMSLCFLQKKLLGELLLIMWYFEVNVTFTVLPSVNLKLSTV